MEKKYFYAAVIDAYKYSEVSTVRYKNYVDFAFHCLKDCIEDELVNYFKGNCYHTDWQDFFDDYYGYTSYFFALDEDGNELEDLEDNNTTFDNYIKSSKKLKRLFKRV